MDEKIQALIDRAKEESRGILVLTNPSQLQDFYLDNLGKYKVWRAIASIEDWLPVNPDFLQNFRKQMSERGIDTRIIFKEGGLKYEKEKLPNRHIRVVPDSYSFKSSIDILEDKILIMNPHQAVLGLVIEGRALIDVFIDMFDVLWNSLPEKE